MPKTRGQKEATVAELTSRLTGAKAVVFATVSGYTMEDANALRQAGRKDGVEVAITKKTLLSLAAKQAGLELSRDVLPGSILAAWSQSDQVAPARVLAQFAKKRESIKLASGIVEGKFVGADVVKRYAALPSREELLAKMVGSINAPVSGFVNVLAGNLRGLVTVLSKIQPST
ncbi:50S ribosomal protein L10 [Candidatus Uhrbacteria bacterium]|nr:50S ribosomal protein L10 [Candidatus Uhrbacteria bacterium]